MCLTYLRKAITILGICLFYQIGFITKALADDSFAILSISTTIEPTCNIAISDPNSSANVDSSKTQVGCTDYTYYTTQDQTVSPKNVEQDGSLIKTDEPTDATLVLPDFNNTYEVGEESYIVRTILFY